MEPTLTLIANYPTEPVELILADKKTRALRYSAATVRRLKTKFGMSLINGIGGLDEETLPEVIYEGLTDKSTVRVTVQGQDAIDSGVQDGAELTGAEAVAYLMPMPSVPYVMQQFCLAWTGALPDGRPPVPASRVN